MPTTHTLPPEAATPPHVINQMECFATAVAMVQNRQRASGHLYTDILYPLVDSFTAMQKATANGKIRPNAGGPAMRLAQAVWDLDYRRLFPNDKSLIAAEENSTGHFYHYYRKMAEAPFHISKAARAFKSIRVDMFDEYPEMPKNSQPDADATQTALCKALLAMDAGVYKTDVPLGIQRNKDLRKILQAVSNAHPLPEELPLAAIAAVPSLIRYLRHGTSSNFHSLRGHHETLKALQYKHTHQLHIWDTELNEAINLLCSYGRPHAQH